MFRHRSKNILPRTGFPALVVSCISLLLAADTSLGADIDLATALAAHRSSRQMIASAHATIDLVNFQGPRSFEWWHVGDSYRVVENAPFTGPDERTYLGSERGVFKGIARSLRMEQFKNGKPSYQATINQDGGHMPFGSLWVAGMCCVNNEDGRFYDNELNNPMIFTDVSVADDGALLKISSKMRVSGNWYDVWLDPAKNCIVTKTGFRGGNSPAVMVSLTEAIEVSEIAPGVYFPTRIRHMRGVDDGRESKISFLSVNQPISEQKLRIRFPANTSVYDASKSSIYIVDADEQPISPETLIAPVLPQTIPNAAPGVVGVASDGSHLWRYATVSLTALAVIALVWRRAAKRIARFE